MLNCILRMTITYLVVTQIVSVHRLWVVVDVMSFIFISCIFHILYFTPPVL